jgi:hypothetical protein
MISNYYKIVIKSIIIYIFASSNEIKLQQLTKQMTKNRPLVVKNRQTIKKTRR